MNVLKFILGEMLVLTIIGLVIGLLLLIAACTPAAAQASSVVDCQMLADGQEYQIGRTIALAEAVPEQTSQPARIEADGSHDFNQANTLVMLEEGELVLLSGSPEGTGFVADDWIGINVQPSNHAREWDFRNSERTRIVPVDAPQEITDLFQVGANHLTLTAKDLLGPVYSSSAYWLLILEPCGADMAETVPMSSDTSSEISTDMVQLGSDEVATTLPTTDSLSTTRSLPLTDQAVSTTLAFAAPVPAAIEKSEAVTIAPTQIKDSPYIEALDGNPNIQSPAAGEASASQAAVASAEVDVESARSPLLWVLSLGVPMGIVLVGLALWQGRRIAPELWDDARQQLKSTLNQLRTRLQELKTQLEAMQD